MPDASPEDAFDSSRVYPNEPLLKAVIGGVIGRVAPAVLSVVDMNDLVEVIDVDVIAADLDLDALIERLDVNAIAARLDLDALIERLDVNAIAARLDLDALMARVDVAQLTAGATQEVAISGLDLARRQLVRVDATAESVVDRVLRRQPGARPAAPRELADPPLDADAAGSSEEVPADPHELRRRDVSGHYAGPATRILGLAGDMFISLTAFGFLGAATLYLLNTVADIDLTLSSGGWLTRGLLWMWVTFYFWVPVAFFGRTIAMAVTGVAVLRRDGGVANGRRAFVRAVVLPVSLIILALGLIGMVVGRERRTLHDLAAGTCVVYDWGARQAEQPVTIRDSLSARVRRRHDTLTTEG